MRLQISHNAKILSSIKRDTTFVRFFFENTHNSQLPLRTCAEKKDPNVREISAQLISQPAIRYGDTFLGISILRPRLMCMCGMSFRRTYRFDLSRSTRTESISFVLRAFVLVCLALLSNEIYASTIFNFISKTFLIDFSIILLYRIEFFFCWIIKIHIAQISRKRSVSLQTRLHC